MLLRIHTVGDILRRLYPDEEEASSKMLRILDEVKLDTTQQDVAERACEEIAHKGGSDDDTTPNVTDTTCFHGLSCDCHSNCVVASAHANCHDADDCDHSECHSPDDCDHSDCLDASEHADCHDVDDCDHSECLVEGAEVHEFLKRIGTHIKGLMGELAGIKDAKVDRIIVHEIVKIGNGPVSISDAGGTRRIKQGDRGQ